ncbi:MAG TPA: M23 family metallopeptidase [Thermoleophilaceae bacterium]|nr:M23 family metallopeptidase [Thermoleophilaceae bacterium]
MRTSRTILACVALLVTLPSAAAAQGGGATAPSGPGSQAGGGSFGALVPGDGAKPGEGAKPDQTGADRRTRRPAGRRGTLLTSFELGRKHVYLHGRPARIRFTLSGRRSVHVRLRVLTAADRSRVATVDLGERSAGEHTASFTGLEAGVLREGTYLLHIAGRGLRRAPTASSTADVEFSHHAFPIAGSYDWGGDGSRFGAKREGHSHQGQDLAAAEGTPVVAPRGGLVEAVQYQGQGAGHYVVLDADDEDHDYVFMHLKSGSITVEEGDRVPTGQRIGEVGNTGRSSGPHLHFEIWLGGWYTGGEPIDPLPLLQSWA